MPAVLARLIFLALAGIGIWAFLRAIDKSRNGSVQQRGGQSTYRPRSKMWADQDEATPPQSGRDHDESAGAKTASSFVMTCDQVRGLRDALTSAPIAPETRPALKRCGHCQALYHSSSVEALQQANEGKCVTCGGQDWLDVSVVD